MRLSHFSDEFEVRPKNREPWDDGPHFMKPTGLWVSVDGEDDWPSWCISERYNGLEKYAHEVTLKEDANVLVIEDGKGIESFTEQFGYQPYSGSTFVSWPSVVTKWDGVIIAPYQWDYRLRDGFFWYYGWDCASGCIWAPRAIESVKLVGMTSDHPSVIRAKREREDWEKEYVKRTA